MIMNILAHDDIVAVMELPRVTEYKPLRFDYKKVPCGIVGWLNFGFVVYLIWVWLGTFE